jgi:hypothetical protein
MKKLLLAFLVLTVVPSVVFSATSASIQLVGVITPRVTFSIASDSGRSLGNDDTVNLLVYENSNVSAGYEVTVSTASEVDGELYPTVQDSSSYAIFHNGSLLDIPSGSQVSWNSGSLGRSANSLTVAQRNAEIVSEVIVFTICAK